MNYNTILVSTENDITTITINRLAKLNALSKETVEELHRAIKQADWETTTRVIVITGIGEKAFVAGADVSEFAHFSIKEGALLSAKGQEILFDFIENLRTPVIAAINGFALGGGLELAMATHLRVASETAKMGLPEVSLGVIPGYGGTQRLPQLVGKGKAMEMILTAEMIDAKEAQKCGLVNYVVPQDRLLPVCYELAKKIIKNSPTAIGKAIEAINSYFEDGIDGYKVEIENFGDCFGTKDFKEGTCAFLEKRKPNFRGE